MSTRLMSRSGTRKCSQNCRYASQGAPSSRGSSERVSIRIGRPPLNWTLYALASRRVKPRSSARSCTARVRSAASLSWPNDHS